MFCLSLVLLLCVCHLCHCYCDTEPGTGQGHWARNWFKWLHTHTHTQCVLLTGQWWLGSSWLLSLTKVPVGAEYAGSILDNSNPIGTDIVRCGSDTEPVSEQWIKVKSQLFWRKKLKTEKIRRVKREKIKIYHSPVSLKLSSANAAISKTAATVTSLNLTLMVDLRLYQLRHHFFAELQTCKDKSQTLNRE